MLFLGQFGQFVRVAGRALGFVPLALRWIDGLLSMRARIDAALFGLSASCALRA
ncbi:hypothetical protein [Burkholderia pseudomallei]|uniref:hypothetical protein n=1 Tax=Burkholderia pseudomallei TaxID=28450 RepID=UPI0024446610|nr:hypothetical protein [Burkholderia pseudomallei]